MSRPTRGPSSRFPVRGCHPLRPAFPDASGTKDHGHWPVPRSLATTDGISRRRLSPPPSRAACATRMLMSVPPATEMFQFAGFASCTYEFSTGYPYGWVSPFGDPGITDRSHLPRAFRSVPRPSSPLSAKASTRCPCFALDQPHRRHRRCHTTAAHRAKPHRKPTGPNPCLSRNRGKRRSRMKTLLSDIYPRASPTGAIPDRRSSASPERAGQTLLPRACPPRSHHYSLFTLQSAPPHFDRGGCRQSSPSPRSPSAGAYRARRWFAGGASRRSFALPVVEVNGFEPMTSCLQSRRSPS